MYVSSTEAPKPWRLAQAKAMPGSPRFSGLLYCVFIHEIDSCAGCPSTDRNLHLLANLRRKGFGVWNSDGLHFDEAATVERFDLEDFAGGDDFTRFFVGAAAKSGSCTEETDEDEHGVSLSGCERVAIISDICGASEDIIPSMAFVVAFAEA